MRGLAIGCHVSYWRHGHGMLHKGPVQDFSGLVVWDQLFSIGGHGDSAVNIGLLGVFPLGVGTLLVVSLDHH